MSRIVLPEAPLRGGEAVRAQAGPGDPLPAAVARFGDIAADAATRWERDRLDHDLAQARIGISRQLADARLEFEQVTDPDRIDAGWSARANELRAAALDGVDPKNRAAADLAFTELSDRHAFALGVKAISLRETRRDANRAAFEQEVDAQAGLNDPAVTQTLLDQYADMVAAGVAAGDYTPEQGAAFIRERQTVAARTRAQTLLTDDPEALAAAIATDAFGALPGPERAALRARAVSAAEARAEQAARAADVAAEARLREIGRDLTRLRDVAAAGRFATDESLLDLPEYRDHPAFAETAAAVRVRKDAPGFAAMTPAEQVARIAAERARPIAERWEDATLAAMERIHEATLRAVRDDPVAHARTHLHGPDRPPPPGLDALDLSDMQGAVNFFATRRGYAEALAARGYAEAPRYFDATERARLAALAAVDQDPAARAQLAAAIATAFEGDTAEVLDEIKADPVFAHAGLMMAERMRPDLAAEVLAGQRQIAAGAAAPPPASRRREMIVAEIGDVFADQDPAVFAQVAEAADALFAARARGVRAGPADWDDTYAGEYRRAVQEVLGRDGDRGGVQNVAGRLTLLPPDVSGREVEAARRHLRARDGDVPARVLTAAALDEGGAVTHAGGAPVTGRDMNFLRFVEGPGNSHYLAIEVAGELRPLIRAGTGQLARVDLARLLVETARDGGPAWPPAPRAPR